ncbi:MAG: 4-hydroxy-tetrahydrodipicolinate reductase [Candidatus Altiarchaeales archaeon HGW-Altiarchaeales-3]|nr:MAG: 4-hydroxy-tetrahydrodipicolinate reductase [Candidatus Altiarchaeales archaeon HGW-Altiarchaeales-3]
MKIGIVGFGKMGMKIAKRVLDEERELACVIDMPEHPGKNKDIGLLLGKDPIGVPLSSVEDLKEMIKKTEPDIMIDFSSPESCVANTEIIAENKINMIIGTTGFTEDQLNLVKTSILKHGIGAVISPNMSIGVNIFWKLASDAAKLLKNYDIEIIEAHHILKKDAPSGTAKKTGEVIADALNEKFDDVAVYGRSGIKQRKDGEIGVHSIRAGDIIGDHTVLFGTLGERIEITHRAHSRDVFVSGTMKAAEFIVGRSGIYNMNDVLKLNE